MSVNFCLYLLDHQVITPLDFSNAVREQVDRRTPIGEVALRQRYLTLTQVFTILRRQSECGSPFGRIACELGILTESQLAEVLFHQSEEDEPLDSILVRQGILSERECKRHWQDFRVTNDAQYRQSTSAGQHGRESLLAPLDRSILREAIPSPSS